MVKFCTKCVISDRRPITSIEAKHVHGEIKNTTRFTDGVCDACLWANDKETVINWKDREKELFEKQLHANSLVLKRYGNTIARQHI